MPTYDAEIFDRLADDPVYAGRVRNFARDLIASGKVPSRHAKTLLGLSTYGPERPNPVMWLPQLANYVPEHLIPEWVELSAQLEVAKVP